MTSLPIQTNLSNCSNQLYLKIFSYHLTWMEMTHQNTADVTNSMWFGFLCHILEIMGHFRIIPRNDFLSKPLPVPVHTGDTMWGWDGFLNWYDDVFPKRDEYQRYTNRESDFYQPLNQAKIYLNETNKSGILKVEVDDFTPGGSDGFLVATKDGEWQNQSQKSWDWTLQSGLNTIKVRTKNIRGILGPVSELNVTYNP